MRTVVPFGPMPVTAGAKARRIKEVAVSIHRRVKSRLSTRPGFGIRNLGGSQFPPPTSADVERHVKATENAIGAVASALDLLAEEVERISHQLHQLRRAA
jgi:hypothetical protein